MDKVLGVIKFIVGILLLPIVIGITFGFYKEISILEKTHLVYFITGIITYLVIHLFVWEPQFLYKKGQHILEILFGFFAPLVKIAPYLLPIYTILSFIIYFILVLFIKSPILLDIFMFLFGFTLILHIKFTSDDLKAKESFLKSDYIFGFSLIYILNIILVSLFISVVIKEFSIPNFFKESFQLTKSIISYIFSQLF
ncbi:MAG: hypothetical protein AB1472_04295 [Candidatus Omnitrophota bacterium]